MNSSRSPLLSLCIPTYNRGYLLKFVLESYLNDPEFDDDVEIVISDNCSTDDTKEICQKFSRQNANIRYFRNTENIKDANFYVVLNYGNGEYLKLLNDWTYCVGDSLRFIKEKVRENLRTRKPLFFTDGLLFTNQKKKKEIICNSLDDYVQAVSTYVTSNNVFGVWRDQWTEIKDKDRYTDLKLQQEDWTYQIVVKGNGCIIYNNKLFETSRVKRKVLGGYNWFNVHMDNYYIIMKPYVDSGFISRKTLIRDKHYLLEHFKAEMCYTYFYNFTKRWRYDTSGTTQLLRKYYKGDFYLLYFFIKLPLYYPYLIVKSVIKSFVGIGV